METTWIVFEGENGINNIFDNKLNKSKKHIRDDALVPFRTKGDKNQYVDFSGVVGAFCRLMSSVDVKNNLEMDALKSTMRQKMSDDCSEKAFDKLFQIINEIYFENGKLLPINTKALNYIDSNISQQQVAEYLFGLFVDNTDLIDRYEKMAESEESNVLEKLLFDSLERAGTSVAGNLQKVDCFLPYVKEVFCKDFGTLIANTNDYQAYIHRFLAYYYMFYVSQLAVKLGKFEHAKRDEIEKVYLTLYDEVVTRVRPGYEYGWKYVKERISHMFSHSVVLEMLTHNVENIHMDYISYYEKFNGVESDGATANEIGRIQELYKKWIVLDYNNCTHDSSKDTQCKTSTEIKKLFETIDFQFINGGRKSHYKGYNRKFIDFVQRNFGKFRGVNGYTVSLHDSDIIMFTQIILKENHGKLRLAKLFEEFEIRGLLFDRESKKKIIDLYEKMNLLEKRSDSGDAQYVRSVL